MISGSEFLVERNVGFIECAGWAVDLPSYIFHGPADGGDPLRIGFFAGIHGDEPAGTYALADLAKTLEQTPELAAGYELAFYPICNPSGFAAGSRQSCRGKDLNREFWKDSQEPEVILLEREIRAQRFHGLISLHSDDTCHGMYGFAKGAVLTEGLLEPALVAAATILPRDSSPVIDGFPARNGIISECYDGVLASPPDFTPAPFEIVLETPLLQSLELQRQAFVKAMEAILGNYRRLLSYAANI